MSFDGETYAGYRQHLVEFDPLRVRDVRDAGQDEEERQQGLAGPRHAGDSYDAFRDHGVGASRDRVTGIRGADVVIIAVDGYCGRFANAARAPFGTIADIAIKAGHAIEYRI